MMQGVTVYSFILLQEHGDKNVLLSNLVYIKT